MTQAKSVLTAKYTVLVCGTRVLTAKYVHPIERSPPTLLPLLRFLLPLLVQKESKRDSPSSCRSTDSILAMEADYFPRVHLAHCLLQRNDNGVVGIFFSLFGVHPSKKNVAIFEMAIGRQ